MAIFNMLNYQRVPTESLCEDIGDFSHQSTLQPSSKIQEFSVDFANLASGAGFRERPADLSFVVFCIPYSPQHVYTTKKWV